MSQTPRRELDCLILTVNYRAPDATENFLRSAQALAGISRARLLIVENGSGDGSAEKLRSLVAGHANVELLESAFNRGYFGAARWALDLYLKSQPMPRWVIVCNNDILFDDDEFLHKLLRRDPNSAGVIAPAIVARETGVDCNPFRRRRPSRWRMRCHGIWIDRYPLMWCKQFLSPYVRRLKQHLRPWHSTGFSSAPAAIYAPHGAFLIFSRRYFEAGGVIDDGFFLFAEEFSVAEICRRLDLRVRHDPELRVFHDGHRVTGRRLNRVIFEHGRNGFAYILRTYFSSSEFAPQPRDSDQRPADTMRLRPESRP